MSADWRPRLWRAVFIVTVLAILVLALMPMPPSPRALPYADKVQHILAFLVLWVMGARTGWLRAMPLAVALLAMGAFIEIAQGLTGYREATWPDLAADAIGIALGWRLVSIKPTT